MVMMMSDNELSQNITCYIQVKMYISLFLWVSYFRVECKIPMTFLTEKQIQPIKGCQRKYQCTSLMEKMYGMTLSLQQTYNKIANQ